MSSVVAWRRTETRKLDAALQASGRVGAPEADGRSGEAYLVRVTETTAHTVLGGFP
jgi:hypothetical protein